MPSAVYDQLNRRWKSTCRILFGAEIGVLSSFANWLYSGNGPRMLQKSKISGKNVCFASLNYSRNSEWISFDEVEFDKKYPPLSINDIKDLDLILQAISDRIVYAGNIILGNSSFVEESTTVTDSHYVLHCERTAFCKYIAYSTRGGYSDHVFGCYGFGLSSFIVRAMATTNSQRCFNVSNISYSSDIYFSHHIANCSEVLFSFNLTGKRYAIGNNILPPAKYFQLKSKLISEIKEFLQKNKKIPSLAEIFSSIKPSHTLLKKAPLSLKPSPSKETADKSKIEKAFSETTNVVLGVPLSPIDDYASWLSRNASVPLEKEKSCISGKTVPLPDYAHFLKFPRDRLVTKEEADFLNENLSLAMEKLDSLSLSNLQDTLNDIAYFCPFWLSGNNKNNIFSPMNLDSTDCYNGTLFILSKRCAFCFSPRSCEYTFGGREGRHNSFCINSHFSTKVTRCFEIDSCYNSSGLYFCHNCENVHDSMFCFNIKNKKYAIGNVEVGPEKFLEAKKILLSWIQSELKAKKSVSLDIYTLADYKKKLA